MSIEDLDRDIINYWNDISPKTGGHERFDNFVEAPPIKRRRLEVKQDPIVEVKDNDSIFDDASLVSVAAVLNLGRNPSKDPERLKRGRKEIERMERGLRKYERSDTIIDNVRKIALKKKEKKAKERAERESIYRMTILDILDIQDADTRRVYLTLKYKIGERIIEQRLCFTRNGEPAGELHGRVHVIFSSLETPTTPLIGRLPSVWLDRLLHRNTPFPRFSYFSESSKWIPFHEYVLYALQRSGIEMRKLQKSNKNYETIRMLVSGHLGGFMMQVLRGIIATEDRDQKSSLENMNRVRCYMPSAFLLECGQNLLRSIGKRIDELLVSLGLMQNPRYHMTKLKITELAPQHFQERTGQKFLTPQMFATSLSKVDGFVDAFNRWKDEKDELDFRVLMHTFFAEAEDYILYKSCFSLTTSLMYSPEYSTALFNELKKQTGGRRLGGTPQVTQTAQTLSSPPLPQMTTVPMRGAAAIEETRVFHGATPLRPLATGGKMPRAPLSLPPTAAALHQSPLGMPAPSPPPAAALHPSPLGLIAPSPLPTAATLHSSPLGMPAPSPLPPTALHSSRSGLTAPSPLPPTALHSSRSGMPAPSPLPPAALYSSRSGMPAPSPLPTAPLLSSPFGLIAPPPPVLRSPPLERAAPSPLPSAALHPSRSGLIAPPPPPSMQKLLEKQNLVEDAQSLLDVLKEAAGENPTKEELDTIRKAEEQLQVYQRQLTEATGNVSQRPPERLEKEELTMEDLLTADIV